MTPHGARESARERAATILVRAHAREEKKPAPQIPRATKPVREQDDVQTREVPGRQVAKPRRLFDARTPNRSATRRVISAVESRRGVEAADVQTTAENVTQGALLDAIQG